jgi:hypothetical protein
MLTCDFCAEPTEDSDALVHYTDEFDLKFTEEVPGRTIVMHVHPEWLACPKCDKLIRAEDKIGLLMRARTSPIGWGHSVDVIQASFWEHRQAFPPDL